MRNKLDRFKDNALRDNVLEPGKEIYEKIKGKWRSDYFENEQPIVLELACGRGEYTVGLGRLFPDRNHIGIDLKGDRIWKGSGIAIEEGLSNIAFLRTHILELESFFDEGEVDEIWLTFPDPRPRKRDIKRRLTYPKYLDIYKKILKQDGLFRFKTDNTPLFEYTLEVLSERKDILDLHSTFDLYHSEYLEECHGIRTRYEQKFNDQGHDIKYLRFKFAQRS
ncbi:MAG: tRNA (guanosine(46)-N7)-methyltransferase TrmB [Bacteroidota bacterium]